MKRLSQCLSLALWVCAQASAQPAADPARACIDAVHARDNQIGAVRDHAPEDAPIADAVRAYADGLDALDYSHCPAAFRQAFVAHARAWRATIPYFERHAQERGEMHAVFERLRRGVDGAELKTLEQAIWDTWAAVEAAARP